MYCRICGDENGVKYRPAKRQGLCAGCNRETPAKVGRGEFDRRYWDGDESVPPHIKREFYSDYLASGKKLDEYIASTTSY